MTREQKTEIWAEIVAMPEKTKVEKLRKANAIRHFENADNDAAERENGFQLSSFL